jgi:E-phenylitaconyl-CoA hydratase
MNAMDPDVYAAISEEWVDVRDNPDVWVAIVTGAGDKAFTAGADLKSRSKRPPTERADLPRRKR